VPVVQAVDVAACSGKGATSACEMLRMKHILQLCILLL
jgi:hypothetical protein